ncbi:MAG: hypothetical protein K6F30_08355 [Lachnospiraceae bacterium]|nr:hypothetical protein [Lachnospiraceae bacterium]
MGKNNGEKKEKKKISSKLKVVCIVLVCIVVFCGIAAMIGLNKSNAKSAGGDAYSDEVRLLSDDVVGDVEVSTLPLKNGTLLQRGAYLFSGKVIYMVRTGTATEYYVCNDNGTESIRICTVEGRVGSRILPFTDNRRVLLGDCVLECPEGQTLDNCKEDAAQIVPINIPKEFSSDSAVMDEWTEVIIAPDNKHFAWTIRRSDCGAVNAMGELVRGDTAYEVENAKYISNMNTLEGDSSDYTCNPIIGGEVKQFVHGGEAISLVGSAQNGMGDSVVQDVATGEVTEITHAPGYDETTIFSPDEKLGMVMTSRFSEASDLGMLGMMDRPYGQVLHNLMGHIYMYSVTGVRSGREGNVGPALIDIEKSMEDEDYMGLDLSDPNEEWIFNSPMSWNEDGTQAMWMEREKNRNHIRLQIATLKDYQPDDVVEAINTPEVGDYATEPGEDMDYDGIINGKESGYVEVYKKTGFFNITTVTFTYHDYSDDGETFYNGTESSKSSMFTKTTYTSDLKVTDEDGDEVGAMDVELVFGAAYKISSAISDAVNPALDLNKSHGVVSWEGKSADISTLVE